MSSAKELCDISDRIKAKKAEKMLTEASALSKKIRNYIDEGNLQGSAEALRYHKRIFDDIPCECAKESIRQQPTYNGINLSAKEYDVCVARSRDKPGACVWGVKCSIVADWEKN